MAEIAGTSFAVEYGGTDISPTGRTVSIAESTGEPERVDKTHRGDSARSYITLFPGDNVTNVSFTGLYVDTGSDPIDALTMGGTGTLLIYPEGKTAGEDLVEISSAYLTGRTCSIPYDGVIEWDLSFWSDSSASYVTYTTS